VALAEFPNSPDALFCLNFAPPIILPAGISVVCTPAEFISRGKNHFSAKTELNRRNLIRHVSPKPLFR
jgi:hypothetical protein